MKNLFFNQVKAGMDISQESIKSVVVRKKNTRISMESFSWVDLPDNTLLPSFRRENILDGEAFEKCLKKNLKPGQVKKIGVSLPDASVKVLIKEFKEVPKAAKEIDEMLIWAISGSLSLPADELRFSWKSMGTNPEGRHLFLVALAMDPVLGQYEQVFKKAGLLPCLLAPAGLNQFNFYSALLPKKGCVVYLGLFDEGLNIFVFLEGVLIFYRMIKKGLMQKKNAARNTSAIDDIDLLIQYFYSENPGLEIDSLHIASHIKSEKEIKQIVHGMKHIEFSMIDEGQLIDIGKDIEPKISGDSLPLYTAALGAALGGVG